MTDEFSNLHDCSAVFVTMVGYCRDARAWCYRNEPSFGFFCFYYCVGCERLCAVIFESFMNVPCSVTIVGVEYGGDKLRGKDCFDFPGIGVFFPNFTICFVGGDEVVDVPCDRTDGVVGFLDCFPSADPFFLRQPYFESAAGDLLLLYTWVFDSSDGSIKDVLWDWSVLVRNDRVAIEADVYYSNVC